MIKLTKRQKTVILFLRIIWSLFVKLWIPFNKFGRNRPSASWVDDFLISLMYFRYFVFICTWKETLPYIWPNLKFSSPKDALCQIGWNWHSGSGEKDLLNVLMYFRYSPLGIGRGPSLEKKNLNQGCFVLSLVEIAPAVFEKRKVWPFISWILFIKGSFVSSLVKIDLVAQEKKMKMWKVDRRTTGDHKSSLELLVQVAPGVCFALKFVERFVKM